MKPVRHASLADAVPVDGRGRTPVRLALNERDALLRATADRFFPGTSQREAARLIRTVLHRYASCAWRRTRADVTCRHPAEKIDAAAWAILRARDHQ